MIMDSTLATTEPVVESRSIADMTLILLAGSHVRQDFVSLMDVTSPAMLPYMGRPLIYIAVLNFLKLGGNHVVVVIPEDERRVEAFLRSSFRGRIRLTIVRAPNLPGATPLVSLETALDVISQGESAESSDGPILIAHGDCCYGLERFQPEGPIVFTSHYIDSDKYSSIYVTEDGYVFEEAWTGKKLHLELGHAAQARYTDIGLYYVPSSNHVHRALKEHPLPVSTVGGLLFHLYGAHICLKHLPVWTDLGHLDTSASIRNQVLGTRECNDLDIDEMRGLITKRGRNREKLLQEINYYNRLPRELTAYFPRMLECQIGKEVSYTVEYYGYKTLSEYLVFYEVPAVVWRQVMTKILAIHTAFTTRREPDLGAEQVSDFYWRKTEARLGDRQHLAAIVSLLDAEEVLINGSPYQGWRRCRPLIQSRIHEMASRCAITAIHGDLCCSNILYDPRTSLIKLIDPRGEFFEEGCYGDARYDLAKLLHSFHGGYDFILHEMYELNTLKKDEFDISLFRSGSAREAETILFSLLRLSKAYELKDLLLLEALLFLTMLPIHSDDAKRQTALYLRGLVLLHEALFQHPAGPIERQADKELLGMNVMQKASR
jgi:hypothetical protein